MGYGKLKTRRRTWRDKNNEKANAKECLEREYKTPGHAITGMARAIERLAAEFRHCGKKGEPDKWELREILKRMRLIDLLLLRAYDAEAAIKAEGEQIAELRAAHINPPADPLEAMEPPAELVPPQYTV